MGKLYTHITRTPGDVIQSTDWNKMGSAIQALDDGKMDLVGGALNGALSVVGSVNASQASTFGSDLTVTGKVTAGSLSATGPITPSLGTAYTNGILFPGPSGASGDNAFIRCFDRGGGARTLHIGASKDPDDNIVLNATGNIGLGTDNPTAKVHVAGPLKVDAAITPSAGAAENKGIVFPKDAFGGTGDNAWIRYHNNRGGESGTLEIGISNEPDDHIVLKPSGNVGIGVDAPTAKLHVDGVVRAALFESTNMNRHRMYPVDPIAIYQDIFDAKDAGVIKQLGNYSTYDQTSWSSSLWGARRMIRFGQKQAKGEGAQIAVPPNCDTVWVRLCGDRWNALQAYFLDGAQEDLGIWVGGYRTTNCYCPDGSLTDGLIHDDFTFHQWLPIPVRRAAGGLTGGQLALFAPPFSKFNPADPNVNDFWVTGLAFSRNPWAHATQSALGFHWAVNESPTNTKFSNVGWGADLWHGDVMGNIPPNTNLELTVPVVPSGRDKLVYLIEHNSDWNGCAHNGLTVNGKPVERFVATYDNPFARHWNSKFYERYIAARIPADFVPADARWIKLKIDRTKQYDPASGKNNGMYFREIGTHDLDIPWS